MNKQDLLFQMLLTLICVGGGFYFGWSSTKSEEIEVTADPMLEATYYHGNLTGKTMADGEPYLPERRTCAIFGYPFGTKLRVSHGNLSTVVKVTDRHDNRTDIDLSFTAFQDLLDQWNGEGRIDVTITEIKEKQ